MLHQRYVKRERDKLRFSALDVICLPVEITEKEEDEPQKCYPILALKPFMRTIKMTYSSQRNVCNASVDSKVFLLV